MATSIGNCFSELLKHVNPDVSEEVKTFLDSLNAEVCDKDEIKKAEGFLEWARNLKYIKLVEQTVPDFILPKHCSGELIDVKVFNRGRPDDAIYDAHKTVRERVARGNTFLNITHGKHKGTRCILYGLKKFTGGLGDDDDREKGDNHTWKRYFTKALDDASSIIATRKANGEAAHLSCIDIDGNLIMCAGSKNVHLLFRNRDDIQHYRGDRFRIANEIALCVVDALDSMEESRRQLLLRFLASTRMTAIFEILSAAHQHVEDLSYLEKPSLQFITWTFTELQPSEGEQLCTVPPHIGIEIARGLGLTTIQYERIPVKDVDSRMKMVRNGYQYEGEVFYFLDRQGHVMGLLKKKTVWYIVCRALREKARHGLRAYTKNEDAFSITKSVVQIQKRILEIQKWLGLSDEATQKWTELGISFMKWVLQEVQDGRRCADDIGDSFPVTWKKHLEEMGLSDQIEVGRCVEDDSDQEQGASASGLG